MSKRSYKIVEVEPDKFKVYYKYWFFWYSLTDEEPGKIKRINELVFNDYRSAKNAMNDHAREHFKPKFKKTRTFFDKNGYEVN